MAKLREANTEGTADRIWLRALEEVAAAARAALPKLRKAEDHGIDCADEVDALELALERMNPVPPPAS